MNVVIDGIQYVPASTGTPTTSSHVDADGNAIHVGSSVRVRLSYLEDHGIDEAKRHATIADFFGERVQLRFENDFTQTFEIDAIRVN